MTIKVGGRSRQKVSRQNLVDIVEARLRYAVAVGLRTWMSWMVSCDRHVTDESISGGRE